MKPAFYIPQYVQRSLWVLVLCIFLTPLRAIEVNSFSELKALWLVNLCRFVQVPDMENDTEWVIGLEEADPELVVALKKYEGRKIGSRTIRIVEMTQERYKGNERPCHLLYFAKINDNRTGDLLLNTKNKQILTIGMGDLFINQPVELVFIQEGEQLRYLVNLDGSRRKGIVISPQLLGRALRVIEGSE